MKPILSLVLATSISLLAAASASAQTARGNMRAVRVQGDVQVMPTAGGPAIKLVEGAVLRDRTSIVTGKDGRAVLLMSTGSAVAVRPETTMDIEEFRQDPFTGDLRKMAEEPTSSRTRLFIRDGSLVSSVKKLKSGSEFTVRNPLGAAGVRGTKKMDSFDKETTSGGSTTITGSQVWQGNFPGVGPLIIEPGKSVNFSGKLDANGNVIEFNQELTNTEQSVLNQLTNEANELDQIFNEAEPVDPNEVQDPAVADPEAQQPPPPAGETETDGGPRNPTSFTSPA